MVLYCPYDIHHICGMTLTCNDVSHCICTRTSHFMGVSVEYIKGQHLYRILIPPAHILISYCVRIGAFDCFRVFGACAGFSSFVHTFYRGSCPENECRSLRLMAAAIVKPRVVLR